MPPEQAVKSRQMYSQSTTILVVGVLLALLFVSGLVWFTSRTAFQAPDVQTVMVRFILIILTVMVGVWTVDKTVAFRINLLTAQESDHLFELFKMMTAVVFGFYFGKLSKD